MPAILIGGEKGGTGKSTTATNIAVMAAMMNHDVILVDATNKQASSAKFITRRNELGIKPTPSCVRIQGKYLHAELKDLNKRYELVIVEAGGYDSIELRSAMSSDVVVNMYSPLKPGEYDLETLSSLDDLVYQARSYNQNLNCYVYFTQVPTTQGGNSLVKDAADAVCSFENLKMANTVIFNRQSILQAATDAHTVLEYEEERRQRLPKYQVKDYLFKGSIEFCNLYKEIFNQEFKNNKLITLEEYQQNSTKEEMIA